MVCWDDDANCDPDTAVRVGWTCRTATARAATLAVSAHLHPAKIDASPMHRVSAALDRAGGDGAL